MAKRSAKFGGDDCEYLVTIGSSRGNVIDTVRADTARGRLVLSIERVKRPETGKVKSAGPAATRVARRRQSAR